MQSARSLDASIALVEAEVELVTASIAGLGKPQGVVFGTAVLAYFAIVGIVLPMSLMAWRPVTDRLAWRRTALYLFVSGLALLIYYLIWSVRQLQKDPTEEPRSDQ